VVMMMKPGDSEATLQAQPLMPTAMPPAKPPEHVRGAAMTPCVMVNGMGSIMVWLQGRRLARPPHGSLGTLGGECRAVQRSLLNLMEKMDLRPPSAAA
jgi:hypothetical protein